MRLRDAGAPLSGTVAMPCSARGFTLAELVVVVCLLGILLGVGAPAFSAMLERNRATAALHQLTASLASARLAAVRHGHPVTLCPTRDGLRCRRDLVWDEGWMIFMDPGRDEHPRSPEAILQHADVPPGRLAIRSTLGRHRVRFQPTGWSSGNNLSLRLCSAADARLLATVIVNNAGRPRTERTTAAAGSCPYLP